MDTKVRPITSENYPFIKVNGLKRRIELPTGEILCKCDGTSSSIRNCLATSESPTTLSNIEGMDDSRDIARAHVDYVRTCVQNGVIEIGSRIRKAEIK